MDELFTAELDQMVANVNAKHRKVLKAQLAAQVFGDVAVGELREFVNSNEAITRVVVAEAVAVAEAILKECGL